MIDDSDVGNLLLDDGGSQTISATAVAGEPQRANGSGNPDTIQASADVAIAEDKSASGDTWRRDRDPRRASGRSAHAVG